MSDSDLLARLDAVEARDAIRDRLHIYCRAIDRRDPSLLKQVYWPEAQVEYGMFKGSAYEFADLFSGWFEAGGVGNTAHLLANATIAVQGESALCESYLHAHHRVRREDGSLFDSVFGGRYHDCFERRHGVWRIGFRRLVFDWFREYPDTGDWTTGSLGVTSANAVIGAPGEDVWPELNAALRRTA